MKKISLLYMDSSAELRTDPELRAVGVNGRQAEIAGDDWIDLPPGGELLQLPGRLPLGFNKTSGDLETLEEVTAMAALLPVGYTRTLLPGYEIETEEALPLMGYTAVGAIGERLKVAAIKTDEGLKWDPLQYNTADLPRLIKAKRQRFPHNRILEQLAKCSLEYHCLTAQNIFYSRWEAGLPVSPACNCDCLGCISLQPAECCPAPQGRINFIPSVNEIVELAGEHLEQAPEAIVSFGQGCEGEPTLQGEVLEAAILTIRKVTSKGTININSNAGSPETITRLAAAGLDSIRVSLFSAVSENYNWYHRPQGFGLLEVKESIRIAVQNGLNVALNLLLFPGFTNQPRESEALFELLTKTGLQQLQLRNLNLDPEWLNEKLINEELPPVGEWLAELKRKFPELAVGNYSRARHEA